MTYSEIVNMDLPCPVKEVVFNDQTILVNQFLPAEDRIDLIEATLRKSYESGLYNPVKLDVYFHVHLVYVYTNIEFTDEEREDEGALYDTMLLSGLLANVLENIPQVQYDSLWNDINRCVANNMAFRNTAAGVISKLIDDLPKNAEAARSIVDNFDPQKFQEVIDFATAANGGRNIFTKMLAE